MGKWLAGKQNLLIALCVVAVALAGLAYGGVLLARRPGSQQASPTALCNPTPASVCVLPAGGDTAAAVTPSLAVTLLAGTTTPTPDRGPAATLTATITPTLVAGGTPESSWLLAGPYLGDVTESTVTVSWVTREPGRFVVRYGPGGAGPQESAATAQGSLAGIWHSAELAGLEPGTSYRYAIYDAERQVASAEMAVTTAPAAGTDHFAFVVMGDSRPGDRLNASPNVGARKVAAQVAGERFDLLLHTGDMVAEGGVCSGSLSGWEQYLRAYFGLYGQTLARAPFYVVPGNHEFNGGSCGREIYNTVFALPRNAPPGAEEQYYSFDWGNAHFVALNTYEELAPGSAQYKWLEHDLASTTQFWKFVVFHEPVYSSGDHGPSLAAREAWVPLFEKYGVDVAFAGHDHIYERTCPILQGACTTLEKGGVVYFVTGGAGAALYETTGGWFSEVHRMINHYLTVDVRGCALLFTTLDGDGNVIDRYELNRCP